MTNSEKINKLDKHISQMNAYLGCASPYNDMARMGTRAQNDAINILKEIGAPQYSISAMQNISFRAAESSHFGGENYNTRDLRDENRCNAYRHSINAIVGILNDVRKTIERKENQKTQRWSLILAAIAAVGTIITLLFTIFDYLCDN